MRYKHYQYHLDELFYAPYKHRTLRTLFDNQSSEWDHTTLTEKKALFGKLIESGRPLESWIDGYQNFYTYELANKGYVPLRLHDSLMELRNHLGNDYEHIISEAITCLVTKAKQDLSHVHALFHSGSEIEALVEEALIESDSTCEILKQFDVLKTQRTPFYLDLADLEVVLKWKLRGQEGRQKAFRAFNTDDNVIAITKAAFAIHHVNEDYETRLRLNLLTALAGVKIPVASAILTLCFPNEYSVIDFRNWRQVFPDHVNKTWYTFNDYNHYLNAIKSLALRFDTSPQKIDIAIWQKDINMHEKKETKQVQKA